MSAKNTRQQQVQLALDALGAYQKQGRISHSVGEMADMLMDESDRGVVVILGSLIEDLLLDRLSESFVTLTPGQMKNLTRAGGLLSGFDDRINLAQALGIIDDDDTQALKIVKAMRNACAHSRLNIDFKTAELKNALALLFDDETAEVVRASDTGIFLRICYITQFVVLSEIIIGTDVEVAQAMGQNLFDSIMAEARRVSETQHSLPDKSTQQ